MTLLFHPTLTCDKEMAGLDSQAACLMDGLIDDYELWDGELPEMLLKDKIVMYVLGL